MRALVLLAAACATLTFVDASNPGTATATTTAAAGLAPSIVSAGGTHTCIVTPTAGVSCWGDGSVTPVTVVGLTGVVSVASGRTHTCALLATATVKCWGSNLGGGLGDGTNTDSPTPVTVAGLTGVTSIAAGNEESCAVLTNGTAKCWGNFVTTVPTTVVGLTGASGISIGSKHKCALLATGGVRCWGSNGSGQLGNGTTTDSAVPVTVAGVTLAAAVVVGSAHSCALLRTRTVVCWGTNTHGELGTNLAGDHSAVAVVQSSPMFDAAAIAAGEDHTCILTSAGGARCWGSDDDGEAGTGVATPPGSGGLNTPVDVVGVTGAVAISAGGKGSGVPGDLFHSHTCVVLKTDAVKCWGSNLDSDLGLGTPGSSPSPVTVVGFSGATAISAGGTDTCAVVANGRAVCGGFSGSLLNLGQVTSGWGHSCGLFGSFAACWGTNQFGELGNASPGPTNVEAQVSGLANASAIAAGGFRSCAILFTQHVSCWGQGPLGNGTTTDSPTPVEVTGITTAIEVAVGDTTACARLADLTVQCWGVNAHGEAGDGTTNVASSPVAVAGLTQAQSISVGVSSACAVVTGGAIFCWGANDQGQLGDGTNTASLAMVQVAGITNATQVSVGGYQNHGFGLLPQRAHACAVLADHSVQCWGANDHGELGDGTTTDSNSPVAVSGIATANTVRAGGFHSCALMTGGVVKCWGSNAEHQLGDGRYPVPAVVPLVKARHTPPPTITALVQNAGRGNSVITITGTNLLGITAVRFGTIGSPLVTVVNSTRITAKVPTNLLPPGKITVATLAGAVTSSAVFTQTFPPKSLTAGGAHSCALTDTHTVLCWGSNSSGQLGIGNHTSSTSPRIVPGLVEPVAVSAGGLFTCAVNGVHAARCWGSNSNGQLGTGTTTASALPVTVSGSGFTGSQLPVVSVATGTAFACATIFDGAGDYVRCWGQNSSGQLGDGTLTQRTRWVPVLVAPGRPLHGIRTIAAGGNTACAILLNAQLWCWGSNNHGQLGRGTLTNSRYAVQVNGFNGVTLKAKSVSVGANHVCALITDGSERCWGSNSAGQLGDGTTIQRTVPTAVLTAPRAKLTGVTAIAAGGLHSCAIIGSGSAARGRCWGSDAAGQLGNTTAGNLRYATLLSGTQADGIRFIAAGGLHTLAIATSRLLGAPGSAGWGLNTSGQLGDGTTVSKPTLTPSPFL